MSKRKVSVIAMKGPPYTFKSTAASAIAKNLGYPILCTDDILDALSQHQFGESTSIDPSPQEAEHLSYLALDLLCQISKSFFDQGIFDSIVIDSRLSSPSQVDQLINCAAKFRDISCLIIIECKPKNAYSWQMQFEESSLNPRPWYEYNYEKWYKPKNWDDVEKVHHQDFDCDVHSCSSDLFRVSKLVLDPFTAFQFLDISESGKTPLFVEAIKYLMISQDPCVLGFDNWREQFHPSRENVGIRKSSCKNGHSITKYFNDDEGLGYEASCKACKKLINGSAYACDSCNMTLHKACAEFNEPLNVSFRNDGRLIESFGKYHLCSSCVKEGKKYAIRCQSCLFESNLKNRLIPTVVKHPGHRHFLAVQFMPMESFGMFIHAEFQCMACGLNVKDRARYYCKLCGFHYELNCVNLPYQMMDEHGGYNHRMTLKYSSKELEDYCCDRCLDKRDPRCWYYSCEECAYDTHVRCDSAKEPWSTAGVPFRLFG